VKRLTNYIKTRETKGQRVICVAFLWILALIAFLVIRLLASHFNQGVPCLILMVTGLYCPGCGTFRAINAGIHLDFWQAFRFNALAVFLLPVVFFIFIIQSVRYIGGKQAVRTGNFELVFSLCIIAVAVVFTILRNIELFEVLRPTNLT